jgi:hypothetical protein
MITCTFSLSLSPSLSLSLNCDQNNDKETKGKEITYKIIENKEERSL